VQATSSFVSVLDAFQRALVLQKKRISSEKPILGEFEIIAD
jgi:hypothetical protein